MKPLPVRFLTWNVHGCVGRDRVCDPERVARVLEAAQPDVSALQEIDNRTRRAARDPFSYFGELFGWTSVAARTLAARDGHYGHIVLSRWPIESLGELDLSVRWREPRKAIVGAVQSPAGRIVVVAAHLGLLPFERRRQLARLKERIADIPDRPIVVLGDFNDFPGRGLAERAPAVAARSDLVQRPARADDDRDAARRGPGIGSPASARELVLAGGQPRSWHGVCFLETENFNAGRPNG
jgi:endonuclease/exonuclease/phosphatase family metal-dependent hydrolase